jgi:hypothetical protein
VETTLYRLRSEFLIALAPEGLGAFILSSTRAVDIQGFEIFGAGTGISVVGASQDVRVLNNTVRDTQFTGIAAYGADIGSIKDVVIDGNTVYRTNLFNQDRPIEQPGGWGMGITLSKTIGGAITNNTSYNNYGEGVGLTFADGAVISGNVVADNFSVQIYIDNSTNSTVENNFVYNTGNRQFYRRYAGGFEDSAAGIQIANERYPDSKPSRNNVIRNNIVIGGNSVFAYANYDVGGGLKDTTIANNTFYGDASTKTVLAIGADAHQNSSIFNNIIYKANAQKIVSVPTDLTGLNFASNLWFGDSAGAAASPTDVNADPRFVNPGGFSPADYQLRANSPAIDRGIGNGLVAQDFSGTTRSPLAASDLGANERTLIQPVQPEPAQPENWVNDFSGDRAGDMIWHNVGTNDVSLWQLNSNVLQSSQSIGKVDSSWTLRGLLDLNGDRQADALWHNQISGDVASWELQNGAVVKTQIIQRVADSNWQIVGFGEFNGDGKADLLWRNSATQDIGIWLMDGSQILGTQTVAKLSANSWQMVGSADFNGDNKTDILWQNPQNNQVELWLIDGAQMIKSDLLPSRSTPLWQVIAANDFNGDNKADILWQNRQTGQVDLWIMNSGTIQEWRTIGQLGQSNWQLVGAKDFVGGSHSDLFWYNPDTGLAGLWEIENGQVLRTQAFSSNDLAWKPEDTKDMTGDGKADVFWRNGNNGAVGLWQFSLNRDTNQLSLASAGLNAGKDLTWRGTF